MNQALNSEHCNCMGIAQVQTNADGEEIVVGCNPITAPEGMSVEEIACPQPHWTAGAGNFIIDFFTPQTIDALGSLITGRPSNQATSDYYAYQTARTRQTGLILGGAILIVILILMYKLLTSK